MANKFFGKMKQTISMKQKLYKTFWIIIILFFCYLIFKMLIGTSFNIPSESMLPTLMPGDKVFVNKTIYGPRLYNVFKKEVTHQDIYQIPGFGNIERGDIMVFNALKRKYHWGELSFYKNKYFIKRCMSIAGDTLQIRDCRYYINGKKMTGVFDEGQRVLSEIINDPIRRDSSFVSINAFPYNCGWTLKDFGPFYIPKSGDTIEINQKTMSLYGAIIRWELSEDIVEKNNQYFVKDTLLTYHVFDNDCYFVAGDFAANSDDSRFWGLVPRDFIVGKATTIIYSTADQPNRGGIKL